MEIASSTSNKCQSSLTTTVVQVPEEEYKFTWSIVNFSVLKEASSKIYCDYRQLPPLRDAVQSPEFSTDTDESRKTISKTVWTLLLYPRLMVTRPIDPDEFRYKGFLGEYISIRPKWDAINPNIDRITCSISLISSDEKEMHTVIDKYSDRHWDNAHYYWNKFISEQELMGNEKLLPNDTLTVRCHLKVRYPYTLENVGLINGSVNVFKFWSDMKDLLETRKCCDVKIYCKSAEFQAHKVILSARSSVFANMFEHNMLEQNTSSVYIEDIEENVMKEFLRYIYGHDITTLVDSTIWAGLYAAADKYDISDLKRLCGTILKASLNVNNICNVAKLADRHSDSELFFAAQKFVKEYACKLFASQIWVDFVQNDYDLANKVIGN